MSDEEVVAFVIAIRCVPITARGAVVRAGHNEQVEVFVVFYQLTHHLHRRRRVDIRIHFPNDEQQIALQTIGVINIRRR